MRNLFLIALFSIAACTLPAQSKPPVIAPQPVTEIFFGHAVTDPYRNLENLADPQVKAWYKGQAAYARSALEAIPGRRKLLEKMHDLDARVTQRVWNMCIADNDRRFYFKMLPSDEAPKIYWRQHFTGLEHLLFDPAAFRQDSLHYAISFMVPNFDGSRLAIGVSANGSECSEILVLDVETGRFFPETIDRVWDVGLSWLPDGQSFFYNRIKSADVHQADRALDSKALLHRVGSDPATDREVFSRVNNPEWGLQPVDDPEVEYDPSSGYLLALIQTVDSRQNVLIAPLSELNQPKIRWRRLFQPSDEVHDFAMTDKEVYFLSAKDAPNFRLLKTALEHPDITNAQVVVPETDESKEYLFMTSAGPIFTTSRHGIEAHLYHLPWGEKTAEEIALPFAAGTVFAQTKGFHFPQAWVGVSGWTHDLERYRLDLSSRKFVREQLTMEARYPEYNDLVVEEVMVKAQDGVAVPLSLIYKKGLRRDGSAPVLMGGYGAYGITSRAGFDPFRLLWTLEGGIVAIAHVRGGGELGETWHKAGMKSTKPNSWKDLIACARFLIDQRYTAALKISIQSGSAGGVLVGRAMTERPDLWAAVLPEVGCLNPMRQEFSANGPTNIPEFGSVSDSTECLALLEMDSYHHLSKGTPYPATFITAGMNDPRVDAWQPGKFAARLQAATASGKPVLFLTDFEGGHGLGDRKSQWLEKVANALAFGLWQSGVPGFQPGMEKP